MSEPWYVSLVVCFDNVVGVTLKEKNVAVQLLSCHASYMCLIEQMWISQLHTALLLKLSIINVQC